MQRIYYHSVAIKSHSNLLRMSAVYLSSLFIPKSQRKENKVQSNRGFRSTFMEHQKPSWETKISFPMQSQCNFWVFLIRVELIASL